MYIAISMYVRYVKGMPLRYLPAARKVWRTPYFVSPWSIEMTIEQWIPGTIGWSLDRGKAKSKDYSYARTLYSLELHLVVPMVLSYSRSTQLELSLALEDTIGRCCVPVLQWVILKWTSQIHPQVSSPMSSASNFGSSMTCQLLS